MQKIFAPKRKKGRRQRPRPLYNSKAVWHNSPTAVERQKRILLKGFSNSKMLD